MTGTPIIYGWPNLNWQKLRADIANKSRRIFVVMEKWLLRGTNDKR